MGVIGKALSAIMRLEMRARREQGVKEATSPEEGEGKSPDELRRKAAGEGRRKAAGEGRRKGAVILSLGLLAVTLAVAVGYVMVVGGGVQTYVVVSSTLCPPIVVSLIVLADHRGVRESLAVSDPSITLVQVTLFLGAGGTVFSWFVPDSTLVLSLWLTFPLLLWAWLLEIGMGLATPLRLPGVFAGVTLGLAKRLSLQSLWWWSAPPAAFLLAVLLCVLSLTVVHQLVHPVAASVDPHSVAASVDPPSVAASDSSTTPLLGSSNQSAI